MNKMSSRKEKEKKKEMYLKNLSLKTLLKYYRGVDHLSQKWQNRCLREPGSTEIFGMVIMKDPIIDMGMKTTAGDKEIVMEKGMVMGIGISKERPMGGQLSKLKHTILPQKEEFPIGIPYPERLVVDKGMVMGMVKIKMIKTEKV